MAEDDKKNKGLFPVGTGFISYEYPPLSAQQLAAFVKVVNVTGGTGYYPSEMVKQYGDGVFKFNTVKLPNPNKEEMMKLEVFNPAKRLYRWFLECDKLGCFSKKIDKRSKTIPEIPKKCSKCGGKVHAISFGVE